MRIYIKSKETKLFIPFPTVCLCSHTAAKFILDILRRSHVEIPVPSETIYAAQRVLKKSIKIHGHFTLVDVESSDGEKVKIVI